MASINSNTHVENSTSGDDSSVTSPEDESSVSAPPFLFGYKSRTYDADDVSFIKLIARDRESLHKAVASTCLGAWCAMCKKKIAYHSNTNSKTILQHITKEHRNVYPKSAKKAPFKMSGNVKTGKAISKTFIPGCNWSC